jgi:hypothetical protein
VIFIIRAPFWYRLGEIIKCDDIQGAHDFHLEDEGLIDLWGLPSSVPPIYESWAV